MKQPIRIEFSLFFLAFLTHVYSQTLHLEAEDTLLAFRGSLTNLQWAEKEVKSISDIISGNSYFNEKATEKLFKKKAPRAGIIHLATHAIINDENPMYSKLVLAVDKDSTEDGFLNTYELYNMKLMADLVVLSACNTGCGKLIRGEGIMSLARGFMYAGCPSIVMSLWPVDDQSTSLLMKQFYKGLDNGLSKDKALRLAKQEYLKRADAVKSNPFYWAGFVPIGNTRPIRLHHKPIYWAWLLVSFGFGICLSWILIRRLDPVTNRSLLRTFLLFKISSFLSLFSLIIIFPYSPNPQINMPQDKITVGFDLQMANEIFDKGEKLFQDAKYDSAIAAFLNASTLYKKEELFNKYVQCLNSIGDSYQNIGLYTEALNYLNQALSIGKERLGDRDLNIAISYHNIGNVYRLKGDYDQAFHFFNQSLSIRLENQENEDSDISTLYTDMCILYFHKGDCEKALELAHRSLMINLKALGENHPDVAKNYNLIGIFYFEKGDYDQALEYYNKCLSIRLETLGDNHPSVAGTYNNIGIVHFYKKEYAKALEFYNKSLAIRIQTYGENHHTVAASYNNIGIVYKNIGEYNEALEYLNKSLSIRLQSLGKNHPKLVYSYHELGSIYCVKREFEKALDILNESLRIRLKTFGKHHPLVSEIYQEIGKVYEKQNRFDKALINYQKSITALFHDFEEKDIRMNPVLQNMSSEPFLLTSLKLKAEALEKRYSCQTHQLGDLYLSIATFELATELIDLLRCGYKAEGSKYLLGDQAREIYKKAIETTLELYELTGDKKLLEKAFTFAEKGKAGILQQALSENKAKQFAGIPNKLLESERQLKMDLAFYEKSIFEEESKKEEADSSQVVLWKDKLFTYKQTYEALIHQFEIEFPNYYNLKYQVNTVSPKEIQQKILDKNTIVIEYFISDSVLIVFTLDKNSFDVTLVDKPPQFENQIESMRTGLIDRDYTVYTTNAYELYQILIQPILLKIKGKDLVIIPDGILGYISFETLITETAHANKEDYRKLFYLIDDFQMAYSYSATLFFENMTTQRMQKHGDYIGFAPVIYSASNTVRQE